MSVQTTSNTTVTNSIPFWRQLRARLLLYFILLAVLPVLATSYFALGRARTQSMDQVTAQLASVADLKHEQIDTWLSANELALDILLSNATVRGQLLDLVTLPAQAETQAEVNALLDEAIHATQGKEAQVRAFFVYDVGGQIVAASNSVLIGRSVQAQPYFRSSLEGNYIQVPYYELRNNELAMAITRPLRQDGQIVGVLAAQLEVSALGRIMTREASLGQTGETYLVSIHNNYLLTPSRFEGYPLTRAYHSDGIDQALQGKNGVGTYTGYRQPPDTVIGAYRWIPEIDTALLAEVTQAEALTLFDQTRAFSFTITIVAAACAAILGLLVAVQISSPIINLTQIATLIASGDLTQQATTRDKSEIGFLSTTFNTMTAQLRDLIATLEQRVKARTHKLETVATLSGSLNAILDFEQLLVELVNQVKEQFNYYQVQVYLLDKVRGILVLAEGYGKVGTEMKRQGMRIDLAASRSLVVQAVRERRVVRVANVQETPNWLPHPLLPDTRSEIAVPIVSEEQIVGVLDVQSDAVDGLGESDADLLRSLANQVGVALTNARLFEQITQAHTEISILNERLKDENLRMTAELNVTRQLQQMLLPTDEELRQIEGLDIAGFMEPADEVGGDYYDVLQHDGQVKIGIGDVTGHGLESGVVMLMIQTAVRTLLTSKERNPARFLNILNQILHDNTQRMRVDKSMSLTLLDYQLGQRKLNASGQHEQMILVRQGGRAEVIDTLDLGFPLGLESEITRFVGEISIDLQPGDGIVLYSDGFTEAENVEKEFYGLERLCDVVSAHWAKSAKAIKDAVVVDVRGFIGEQTVYDDLTLLVVKQK